MKKALVTGITGQDGSYLSELLLDKGYQVFGIKRRSSTDTTARISHLLSDIEIVEADLCDYGSLARAVATIKPNEVYNLGALSYVKASFDEPEVTGEITGLGTTRILEALRQNCKESRFYQASSSEMFGKQPPPHNESTPFYPRSPYGVAKVYAYWMTVNYREQGMFCCNGILYNHESPRRGSEFVTQKIAQAVASIKLGYTDKLELGNLSARRDWGHARDFVRAMWLMLQQDKPDDYVVATGESHSVEEFVNQAFARVGLDPLQYVSCNQDNLRPTEVDHLCGDASKAKKELGWQPQVTFRELVNEMVDYAVQHPEEWRSGRRTPAKS